MGRILSLSIFLAFLVYFSTLPFVNAEVTDISTDKQALLALKSRISHDPSNLLANNWSISSFFCDWIGVTCGGVLHQRVSGLNISNLGLTGTLPPQLGNLSFLVFLSIRNNSFHGSLPDELTQLHSLKHLDFDYNRFSGGLPESIFDNLPNLEFFSLHFNMFQGKIPSTLSKCKHLQQLFLSSNNFSGAIPKEIGNLTQLKRINLGSNKLQGEVPYEIGNLHNLEGLELQSNHLIGPVPAAIFNISTIKMISLFDNQLSGILPSTAELPSLQMLYLWINNFSGPFPGFITNASKLQLLEIGTNSFSGIIPSTIGNLKNLEVLTIDNNHFTSSTPDMNFLSSLANCKNLRTLWFDGNPFNSILPSSIGNLSISLELLSINDCNISGNIPKEIEKLNNLMKLDFAANELTGSIPLSLGGLQKIQGLYLQNNKLQGFIPNNLCHLNNLVDLYLDGNKISGSVPACLGNLTTLRKLSLGFNMLTSLPSNLCNLKDILYFNLSSNSLNGPLPLEIGNLKAATNIDLSRNLFSGNIPVVIASLENLQYLSLGYNRLEGSIPETLDHLISLEFLDLSSNKLSGVIPKSLENLSYLKYLNLSFNQLGGDIPTRGCFANLSRESFMGNIALCGFDPKLKVPPCKSSTHRKSKVLLLIVLSLSIAVTLIVLVFLFLLLKYHKKGAKQPPSIVDMSPQETWRRISYHELVRATNGFSENNLLGTGSFGSVYKGQLGDSMELAVKVFHLHLEEAFTSFEAECEILSRIRHRNLVKIITCCFSDDFKALVLEYMPNGSLEKCLYSDNHLLDISLRLNIMIDVASALEYLHFGYSTLIIHCDLKPSNVLLDENMVAHLSDFGISKLLGEEESMTQTQTLATIGYMAPEYGREGKVSRKGDVYSYGIMVMEIFTRKKPTDEIFTEEMSLRSWVGESLNSTTMKVVDSSLLRRDDEHFSSKEEGVSSILSLAMECTRESPAERISIKEVVTRLLKIRDKLPKFKVEDAQGYQIQREMNEL